MFTLNIMDRQFRRKAIINTYTSLTWEQDYQDKGGFVLVLSDVSAKHIDEGDYIAIQGEKVAMVVVSKEIVSELRQVTVAGHTTIRKLLNRVIRYPIDVVNAEKGIYDIVAQNVRGLENFEIDAAHGFTETFEMQYTWDEVLPAVTEIAKNSGIGIRMIYDLAQKKHVFQTYKGVDRRATQSENTRAIFSEEFKNIKTLTISEDSSYFKNVAYVSGGNDETPVVVEVGTATGDDRREMYVDGRDIKLEDGENYNSPSYRAKLHGKGLAALSEYIYRRNFKIEVNASDYGRVYALGDLISCKTTRYGMELSARIIKHAYVAENNNLKVKLTVGDAKLDALGEIKLWK